MSDLERLFVDLGPAALAALLFGFVVLLALHLRLQARVGRMLLQYQRLVRDGPGGNLEELLDRQLELADRTSGRVGELEQMHAELRQAMRRAVQRVGLVRFNPFSDTGGDQSFSIALLDGEGDGLVISSLFSRSETRVFAKPIQSGQSKYNLTEEEQQAILLATDAGTAEPARTG
ncbi:MAG TPA: DUF4446 family protein [Chloroflexota bacterium]|jgi:hypothetical protein|nr:DUF4446 family protein [Chloroflexota bacterium]